MHMCETDLFLLPVWNMTVGTIKIVNLSHRAKFRGDRSNRCGDMAIFRFFQDGGHAMLNFLNKIFNDRARQKGRTESPWQTSSQSVRLLLRYGDFSISQDGSRHHLGFLNFWNFNGSKCSRGPNCVTAKFRGDRSDRRWDMAIFRFFQDGGCPPSWIYDAHT